MSYATESDCAAGHILTASVCRSAFASARLEFASKTPAFASMSQCTKAFGTCAAWPPGHGGRASFRPQWSGVDIVDTPHEKSVTPALGGMRKISFAPLPLTAPVEERDLVVRAARQFAGRPTGASRIQHAFRTSEPEKPYTPAEVPPPGSGFKVEDGVLTYPAPARFAPKNLPKQP